MKVFYKKIFGFYSIPTLVFSLLIGAAQGQSLITDYQFTTIQGVYEEIYEGTVVGNTSIDEQVFNNDLPGTSGTVTDTGFPIGFSFTYNGETYDHFAIATNGYIKLGNGTFPITGSVSTAFTTTFGDTIGLHQIIAAMHGDLQGQTGSSIRFLTVGNPGSRELVVQWKKMKFWNTTGADSLNFQIRLKESGNMIEFAYGNVVRNSTDKAVSIGINGNFLDQALMRRIRVDSSETWATSSTSFSPNSKCDIRSTFLPPNGLKFRFMGLPPIENDVAVLAIILRKELNFGCAGLAAEPISIRLQNKGTLAQTSIEYGYNLNGTVVGAGVLNLSPALASGEIRIVPISQTLNMQSAGIYQMTIFSSLPLDLGDYQANDTARLSLITFAPVAIPFAPLTSLSQLAARGWNRYNGSTSPIKPGNTFQSSTIYNSNTIAVYNSAFPSLGDTINEWIVSPAHQVAQGMILKFRAAISGFDSVTAVTNIDDDEFSIMTSTDCGSTWQSVFTFNQASLASGAISKIKKGFSFPISASGPFQVAILANNNGTAPASSYYFHIDDITIGLGNAYDLAAKSVSIVGLGASGCSQSVFPVKMWVKNVGDSALNSSDVSVLVNGVVAASNNIVFSPILDSGDSVEINFPSIAIPPNNAYKLVGRAQCALEDGFSSGNDTASVLFSYLGSTTPLTIPSTLDFNALPTGIPTGWLVDQGTSTDFRVRVRGTQSSRSLSANLYSNNKASFAIMPSTDILPSGYGVKFDIRIVNDNAAAFTFGTTDSVMVLVSDDCGANFSEILKINAANQIGINTYGVANLDLSAYVGKAVSVRFDVKMTRTFPGAWVDIDNINFAPYTAIESEISSSGLEIFPNPVQVDLTVRIPQNAQTAKYRLLDLQGKSIEIGVLDAKANVISLINIPSGIYILEVVSAQKIYRNKVVKK